VAVSNSSSRNGKALEEEGIQLSKTSGKYGESLVQCGQQGI
jgi:hypothetical protein